MRSGSAAKSIPWIALMWLGLAAAVQALNDGVVVLQRHGSIHPGLEQKLDDVLQRPLPPDPRKRKT